MIALLMELSRGWKFLGHSTSHKFGIGDIFMEGYHGSHFRGSAVDIFVIHKDGTQRIDRANMVTWNKIPPYDRPKTKALAQLIAGQAPRFGVIQFLYNDKALRLPGPDYVPSSPPITFRDRHDEHIHLTFGECPRSDWELDFILEIETAGQRNIQEGMEYLQRLLGDFQNLMYGSRGAVVEALQALLNHQGGSQYPPLEKDGEFGPKTTARVQEFQRRNGLVADGIVGPQTKQALAAKYK